MMAPSIIELLMREFTGNELVFGPLVWQPSDGLASKQWYFIVASQKDERFHVTRIDLLDHAHAEAEEVRELVITALLARTERPLICHDTSDELYAARLCELIWPDDPRPAKIRRAMETERTQL